MPRQNRVTPFGELIATPARGTLMGNRGCLHDPEGRIRHSYVGKRWIICVLEFKGRQRRVMTPGRYTELFFLDEATALAAGHRPCAECQRGRYLEFRGHWAAARRLAAAAGAPSVDDLDDVLHAERVDAQQRRRTYVERWSRLPDGVMVADDDDRACLVHAGRHLPWTPSGYGPARRKAPAAVLRVLTPRSIVAAIRHGYPVQLHQSAR
ncbi:MAG TPA: hypothetical protein VFV05_17675 [Methylomirabilota bacterium]|nr:hypothetical protein [Methylomirabilota bacterium]